MLHSLTYDHIYALLVSVTAAAAAAKKEYAADVFCKATSLPNFDE
jgi:hypothetical protein